jgi:hypothetical protein
MPGRPVHRPHPVSGRGRLPIPARRAAGEVDLAARRLDDPDRHVRRAAADELIAAGTDEVRDLMLARLRDETTEIEWPGVLTVLQGLGDRAFDALVDLLAGDNGAEVVRRAGSAFMDLRVPPRSGSWRCCDTLRFRCAAARCSPCSGSASKPPRTPLTSCRR